MKKLLLFFCLFFNFCPTFLAVTNGSSLVVEEPKPPVTKPILKIFNSETCAKIGIKPLELHNNEVLMPQYDGVNYFIDANGMRPSAEDNPSQFKIEESIKHPGSSYTIENISDLVGGLSGVDFKKLPMVLTIKGKDEGKNVTIVILSIIFSQTDTRAQAGILTALPDTKQFQDEQGNQQNIYFGAELTLKKGGAMGGAFALIAPKTINLFPLAGIAKISLSVGTGICLGCEARSKNADDLLFFLSGTIEIHPNIAITEDLNGKALSGDLSVPKLQFSVQIPSWKGASIKATLPKEYGIQLTKLPFIGFQAKKVDGKPIAAITESDISHGFLCTTSTDFTGYNVIYDFSDEGGMVNNKKVTGLIFQNLSVRLPTQIRDKESNVVRLDVDYFYMDDNGVSTVVSRTQAQGQGYLVQPQIEGIFDLGIKDVGIKIDKNALVAYKLSGDLELPILKGYDLFFGIEKGNQTISDPATGQVKTNDILSFSASFKQEGEPIHLNLFLADATIDGIRKDSTGKTIGTAVPIIGQGTINLTTGNFESFGVTMNYGNISLLKKDNTALSFNFDKLAITTKSPYLEEFTLTPNGKDLLKVAGFSLGISSLSIKGDASTGIISGAATVNLKVTGASTNQAIKMSAGLVFKATTRTADGKKKFQLENFGVEKVAVRAVFPSFGFEGSLDLFNDAPRLGVNNLTGFEGKAKFWFNIMTDNADSASTTPAAPTTKTGEAAQNDAASGKAGGGVYMIFAKNNAGQDAWAVDVDVNFGKVGIPLGVAVSLKGIFGGVYSNLKIKGDPIAKAIGDKGSRTGLAYGWDPGRWGFNIGLDLSTATGNVDISAMLAVEGKVDQGLSFIKAAGYAKFKVSIDELLPGVGSKLTKGFDKISNVVNKIPQDIKPSIDNLKTLETTKELAHGKKEDGSESLAALFNKTPGAKDGIETGPSRVAAGIIIALNFENGGINSLSVKMYPDIFIDFNSPISTASLKSTGYGMLYLSRETKYLYLGNSKSINDRLGLKLQVSTGDDFVNFDLNGFVNAYFMLGNGVGPNLPPPLIPKSFSEFLSKKDDLEIDKKYTENGELEKGTGIAFGAAVGVRLDLNIAYVFGITAEVGAGFDALLVDKAGCDPSGGWNDNQTGASGTGWKAQAQIYGYAKAEISVLFVTLAEFGVGFLLKASIPKPLYAEGFFTAYLRIWKAEAKFTLKGKIGKGCLDVLPPNVYVKEKFNLIDDFTPNVTKKFSPVGNMYLKCKYPQDQVLAKLENSAGKFLQQVDVKISGGNVDGTDMDISKTGIDPNSHVEDPIKLTPSQKLGKNKTYKVVVITKIYSGVDESVTDKYGNVINFSKGKTVEYKTKNATGGDVIVTLADTATYQITTVDQDFDLADEDVLAYPAKNQYNVYRTDYDGKGFLKIDKDVADKIQNACSNCNVRLGIFKDNVLQGATIPILLNVLIGTDYQLISLEMDKIYEIKILATIDGQDKILYQNHNFRISKLETFAEKVASLSNAINPNWNPNDLEFNLITNNPSPNELFSDEEIKQSLGLKIKTEAGTWLKTTLDNYNKFVEGSTGTSGKIDGWDNTHPSCKQSQYPQLKDGQISFMMSEDKNNYASPAFVYAPFQATIISMINKLLEIPRQSSGSAPTGNNSNENRDQLLVLNKDTQLCLELKSDITKLDYYKTHSNDLLPARYSEQGTNLCFKVPLKIDFYSVAQIPKTVVVKCNVGAFDSQPIVYSFELKDSEGISLKFPTGFSIACTNNSNSSKNDSFTDVQDFVIADGISQPVMYASKRKSVEGCPAVNQFMGSGSGISGITNKFQVIIYVKDTIKPCLSISAITSKSAVSDCINICNGMSNQDDASSCREACNSTTIATTENKFKIESWENNSRSDVQALRKTITLKLSNGTTVEFPEKQSEVEITISDENLKGIEVNTLTILVEENSPYTCGGNLGDRKLVLPGIPSTGNGNSLTEACQSTEQSVLYCAERLDNLVIGNSIFYSKIEPNLVGIDKNFYAFNQGAAREVYVFEKGIYTQKYFCGANPQMEVICKYNQVTTSVGCEQIRNFTINFFSMVGGVRRAEFPWYIPETGLMVGGIVIPKNDITSSTITKNGVSDGNCTSDNAFRARLSCNSTGVTGIPNVIITSPPNGDCAVKPTKPTLSTASINNLANYGEQISLTAMGCVGKVQWNGIGETTATIKHVVANASTFFASCIDASTNCLSEQSLITINLKDVSISAVKDYVCEGQVLALTADGCGATPEWSSDDVGLDLSGATGLTVNVKPTKVTKFTLKCKVDNANAQIVDKSFAFHGIIANPIIHDDIAPNQNETICVGEAVKIGTSTACETGKILEWSNNRFTPFISVKPLTNTTYYAVCKDEKCTSVQSNKIDIVSITLKKAIVTDNTYNKTACVGNNFVLTATNCEATDVVYWYKKGVDSSFSQENTITISETIPTTYTYLAKCRRSITADKTKWCEGDFSDGMSIKVVTPNDLSVSLIIGTNSICAYQSTTLTASGCDLGILEWQFPNESTWKVLPNGAKQYSTNTQGLYKVRCNLNNLCYNVDHTNGTDVSQYLTINPEPQAPALTTDKANNTICAGESISLSGTCSLGSLIWQDSPLNPIKLVDAKTYTYNAVCKSDKNCKTQTLTPINIIVNPIPQKLTISSSVGSQMCEYDVAKITANGCGEKVLWKDNTTVNPIVDFKKNKGEYYFAAKCEEKGCTGVLSDEFKLTVYNRPEKPSISISKASVCSGQETITLSVVGCDAIGSTIKWNDNDYSRTKTLSSIGHYEYSVKCIQHNCESLASDVVKVDVLQTPSVPVISSSNGWTICDYNPTTISTGCSDKSSPDWGANSTLVNVYQSGNYTVYCKGDNGCNSNNSDSKILTVYNRPTKPTISVLNDNICSGTGSMTTSVNGCNSGSVRWNDGDTSPTKTFSNAGGYDYKVVCIQNNCESESSENAHGEIRQTPNAPSISGSSAICEGNATGINSACQLGNSVWKSAPAATGQVGGYNYTAVCQYNGCESSQSSFGQTVNSYPVVPNFVEDRQCGKTVLTVNNCGGGSVSWSNKVQGNRVELFSQTNLTAYCNQNGCVSNNTFNSQDVKQNPQAPVIGRRNQYGDLEATIILCNINQTTLSSSVCSGCETIWWDGSTGTTKNITPANLNTESRLSAVSRIDGCTSGNSYAVSISFLNASTPNITTSINECQNRFSLTNSCEGQVVWYSEFGSQQGVNYNTNSAVSVFAKCENSGCISSQSNTVSTSSINTGSSWQAISYPCYGNKTYRTEQDNNSCSSTYGQTRDIETGNSPANWQPISYPCYVGKTYRREQDNSPCSTTSGQTRDIETGNSPANWQDDGNGETCSSDNSVVTCTKTQKDQNGCSETGGQTKKVQTNVCSEILQVAYDSGSASLSVSNTSVCSGDINWYYTGHDGMTDSLLGTIGGNIKASKGPGQYEAKCNNACGTVSNGTGIAY